MKTLRIFQLVSTKISFFLILNHAREIVQSTFWLSEVHKRNDFLRPRALRFSTQRFSTCSSNVLDICWFLLCCFMLLLLRYAMLSILPPLTCLNSYQFLPPLCNRRERSNRRISTCIRMRHEGLRPTEKMWYQVYFEEDACRVRREKPEMDKREERKHQHWLSCSWFFRVVKNKIQLETTRRKKEPFLLEEIIKEDIK